MTFGIKNNKAIVLFVLSSLALYIHELYRLSLGCPRVLGECYLDGSDRYIYVYLCSINLLYICVAIFLFRIVKRCIDMLKEKK